MKKLNTLRIALTASLLSVSGIAAAEFSDWDADGNGALSQEEWNTGWENEGAFDTWDSDDDGLLSQNEFETGIGDGEAFADNDDFGYDLWDTDGDGLLDSDEVNEGFYNTYDENSDNVIEEPEYDDFGDDMGDAGAFDV